MKTKLLFVIPSLTSGGGERSLINLLSQIDYGVYDVDLFLINPRGLFMEFIPPEVRVLPRPKSLERYMRHLPRAVAGLAARGRFGLALRRILFSLANRAAGNDSVKEQRAWRHLAPAFPELAGSYDAAVGFLEKTSIYYCVEKVKARVKVGWIHNDYDELGMDPELDRPYFERLQHLVTVSEECASKLEQRFPEKSGRIHILYNIVSPRAIRRLAGQPLPDADVTGFQGRQGEAVRLLSIGRLHPQKAFELAIEACRLLRDRGYEIHWDVIGEGEERNALTAQIEACGLQDRFRLLGLRSNPYPYIQAADIYVQTSRFEGKSIAIDEAKILNKPIVVTDFSTAVDQIANETDGLIVGMNPEAIAAGIARLIDDPALRERLSANLAGQDLGTENEIYKFYNLLASR
ncbi:glycosyltransferase [Paenibacillus spiritus]|uniref:Glycosyltransferase n=1 Tax=Paenibacillus spiritus TaxID=2496557 RepID=A0A5J5FVM5_9BACL|nr:glycosyltransferase [Paenibacillus spiritus]KAA8997555.1 glycosyltransferase [Paenibacillus spiritus]